MSRIMKETITIKKLEYDLMVKRIDWLVCLENAGVDNWEGFDYAHDEMSELYPEDYKD